MFRPPATDAVGAYSLDDRSDDAAVLVALNPGAYTVAVGSASGGTGVALIEFYRVAP